MDDPLDRRDVKAALLNALDGLEADKKAAHSAHAAAMGAVKHVKAAAEQGIAAAEQGIAAAEQSIAAAEQEVAAAKSAVAAAGHTDDLAERSLERIDANENQYQALRRLIAALDI